MFEKLKDIFYDLNDLLVTLIIILVIVLAIAYVFTNAFDLDLNRASVFDFFGTHEAQTETEPPATTDPATVTEPETTVARPVDPETGIVNVDPETNTPSTPTPTPTEPTDQTVVVTMAEGMSLSEFAQLLQTNGVISDYQSFVNLVVSQGLDTQVQALSYTFPLDITDAEAVRIMFP